MKKKIMFALVDDKVKVYDDYNLIGTFRGKSCIDDGLKLVRKKIL